MEKVTNPENYGKGFYYLHVNGELIFKKFRPEDDSPFVKRIWEIDFMKRGTAYVLLLEAWALGANRERVEELVKKWGITNNDCLIFAGLSRLRLFKDGDQWCCTYPDFVNLQESLAGFGETAFEAMANLPKPRLIEDALGEKERQ